MPNIWTKNQLQAINKHGKNILVAAAAGSGKTTVLVERIINKIINEKVDIDKLLIVTFTNAAASEMRQRILDALYSKIEEDPENANLQRQILLLNKANISTIHAFCLEVIKNNFYEIGIPSNFRIGDTSEIELLKQETLEEVFDELYETGDQDFIDLVNTYSSYRDDINLKELVLKIYNFSQSMPFPEEWVNNAVNNFNVDVNKDFAQTTWGKILIDSFNEEIEDAIEKLKNLGKLLEKNIELDKYYSCILNDTNKLKELLKHQNKWDDIVFNLANFKPQTWPRQTKADGSLKDTAKEIRDEIRKNINTITQKIFTYNSIEANKDLKRIYGMLKEIENIIIKFSKRFQDNKKEKNILDFNDIEHFALNILVKKDDNNNYIPTNVANEYRKKFVEIAIDEYQDSNLVQEYILSTISKGNNIFMVGDVKQSIYKFRGARPELFLEKYNKYDIAENEENDCIKNTKIKLFENFRSRENVLNFANMIFENIMSKKIGDIDYTKEEYLNCSSLFEEPKEDLNIAGKAEINIIDLSEDEDGEDEEELEGKLLEKTEIEAKFVANRIKQLLNSNYYVFDKNKGYRKIEYKDIVILLRTTANVANIYEKELNNLEIPVFSDVGSNCFETEEMQVILSVLKIIDNPNSDIPLVTVLRSPIGDFTDNELIEIRLNSRDTSFYDALYSYRESEENTELRDKVIKFLNMLNIWQQKKDYLSLDELIWYIYENTNYYDFVNSNSDGEQKTANLRLLFEKAKEYETASFKGLYNFINYIDRISNTSGDMGSAKLIGENENVVRIMSIHKSKGLEFPVVFLSGTGKQFNMQDLTEEILLHQDLGFGPKIIDYERKIEYNTLAKEAIKVKSTNEILSEEMRLLYVALTRAKEKIIITGCDKNLKKSLTKKEKIISNFSNEKISAASIRKAKSYLDWIEMVCKKNEQKKQEVFGIFIYNKNSLNTKTDETNEKEIAFQSNAKNQKEIDRLLNWEYKYLNSTKIEGKASVTAIAKGKDNKIELNTIPKFMSDNKKLSSAEIGTLMHLIIQKLDFKENYNKEKIVNLIEELVAKNIILSSDVKYINIEKILKFTESELYMDLKEAKKIYKEQPFYISIPAKDIYSVEEDESILIQGIIDLYYINKNDEIILVDYKTDYVKDTTQELIDKYKAQLKIYKTAIEHSLNKKVSKVYIYSLYLNKEIKCDI